MRCRPRMTRDSRHGCHRARSFGSLEEVLLPGRLRPLDEQVSLSIGFLDAAAGDVEIRLVDLNAGEAAAELDGGNAGSPRAHKGINDGGAIARKLLQAT